MTCSTAKDAEAPVNRMNFANTLRSSLINTPFVVVDPTSIPIPKEDTI